MKKENFVVLLVGWFFTMSGPAVGQGLMLDSVMHHIRNTGSREWSEFPERTQTTRHEISFRSSRGNTETTLSLRQYDVKLNWKVVLNGQILGALVEDEKDLYCYLAVPPGVLRGKNKLEIYTTATRADDIRVGEIMLYPVPLRTLLSQATIDVEVVEDETGERIPSRITVADSRGILQPVSGSSNGSLAIRTGHLYTSNGSAAIGVPAGTYTLYATRGFEYGVDSAKLVVREGGQLSRRFRIRREVDTRGWVSSDTHIHTFTWSAHGDATSSERAVTIAGEGIELPVITDHNVHVDLKPLALEHGVDRYFTAVTGNEVTTTIGHFNVFPVRDEEVIDHQVTNWADLSGNAGDTNSTVMILNHARDIHLGFRPFDPSKHLAIAGMRLDGWPFPANAMEVINSGSQQTDPHQLTRDWFGMLNGGYFITPAGSSDSHDVSRYIVGQARTYVRCNDDETANIDLEEAVRNFLEGNVTVSFGLLTEIEVNGAYGPGELVPVSDEVKVSIKVSGPAWTRADRVVLYANGKKIRQETITGTNTGGLKWSGDWSLTMPSHDVFLVAVAEGPAQALPFWPVARPFQPTSPEWVPAIFGLTGAVWLDGDRNAERNSARYYADDLIRQSGNDMASLVQRLAAFHESVAVQAAALLHTKGEDLDSQEMTNALLRASGETRAAFAAVKAALQQPPE